MKADLHIHSKRCGHSNIDPKLITKVAAMKNLDVIAITDHNSIEPAIIAKKYNTTTVKVIIGEEIRATKHIEVIGLFLEETIAPRLGLKKTVKAIRDQGGLVVFPHPFDIIRFNFVNPSYIKRYADLIEVYNGRTISPWESNLVKLYAAKYKIPMLAASDAHYYFEVANCWIECQKHNDRSFRSLLETGEYLLQHNTIHPIRVIKKNILRKIKANKVN